MAVPFSPAGTVTQQRGESEASGDHNDCTQNGKTPNTTRSMRASRFHMIRFEMPSSSLGEAMRRLGSRMFNNIAPKITAALCCHDLVFKGLDLVALLKRKSGALCPALL
jgi:hypothetical protein